MPITCSSLDAFFGLVSSPISASAQQYADPAIAICDYVKLREQTLDPSYERLSGDIHNQTASIVYQMSVLDMAPTTQIAECRYRLGDNGFEFDFAETEMEKACLDAWNNGRELAVQLDFGPDEMIIIALTCEPHLKAIHERNSSFASAGPTSKRRRLSHFAISHHAGGDH